MGLWQKITEQGIHDSQLQDWDIRNIRFMNTMTFILGCAMLFFALMGLIFDIYEALPQIAIAFLLTLSFYIIRKYTTLNFAKIYFCLGPIFIVSMFAISVVGLVGND